MPYINPAELLNGYFTSPIDKSLQLIPTLLANRRQREALNLKRQESEKATKAYADLMNSDVNQLTSVLPQGITPQQYISGVQSGIFRPITPSTKSDTKSQIVGNQLVTFGPEGSNLRTQSIPGLQPQQEQSRVLHLRDNQGNVYRSHQTLTFSPQTNSWVWIEQSQEPIEQVMTPEEKINFEVNKQNALRPGIIKTEEEKNKIKPPSPNEQIAQMKLNAWSRIYSGNPTQQDLLITGTATDPFLQVATRMVMDDLKLFRLPVEEKIRKALEYADLLRKSTRISGQNNQGVSLPPEIKTTSQAIQYLMNTGMTQEQAIQWIKDNS